jgi:hypothetical protein
MTKIEKKKIYNIAISIRKKLLSKYKRKNFDGYCYHVSEYMQLALEKEKIFVDLICGSIKKEGYLHYWLEYKGNIIDLTAYQFNKRGKYKFPLILIKPISKLKCFIKEDIV